LRSTVSLEAPSNTNPICLAASTRVISSGEGP